MNREDYACHPNNTKHYIVFNQMTDWGLPNKTLMAEIDPNTLELVEGGVNTMFKITVIVELRKEIY